VTAKTVAEEGKKEEEALDRVEREVEELASRIVELINALEKTEERAAAMFVALGHILSYVDAPPFTKAGAVYALRLALDEMLRQIIREAEPAEYIL